MAGLFSKSFQSDDPDGNGGVARLLRTAFCIGNHSHNLVLKLNDEKMHRPHVRDWQLVLALN
jgi:hypothetical protein